jgi:hypothetical protein
MFTYQIDKTDNIMDYATINNYINYISVSLWQWQTPIASQSAQPEPKN